MKGIEFDNESLRILRAAQPEASEICNYAIFGRVNGKVVGRRGGFLELTDDLAKQFIAWFQMRCWKVKQATKE